MNESTSGQPLWPRDNPEKTISPVQPNTMNSLAVAALVCGILLPPLGIVLGHISLSQIKARNEEGRALAVAGLIVGYAFCALSVVTSIVIYTALRPLTEGYSSGPTEQAIPAQASVLTISSSSTTPTVARTVPPPTVFPGDPGENAFLSAVVGDCLHYISTDSNHGFSTMAILPCSDPAANSKVVARTLSPRDCSDGWVGESEPSLTPGPTVYDLVLCLVGVPH